MEDFLCILPWLLTFACELLWKPPIPLMIVQPRPFLARAPAFACNKGGVQHVSLVIASCLLLL